MSTFFPTKGLISFACIVFFSGAVAKASGPGETEQDGTQYIAGGGLAYAQFEQAVPHSDLEACPAEFDPEAVFCRLTLASDLANVWVFSFEGEQPLLAVKSYTLDGDFLPF